MVVNYIDNRNVQNRSSVRASVKLHLANVNIVFMKRAERLVCDYIDGTDN